MDFAQLKGSLKSKIEPAYLIYGSDYFLLNKAVDLVAQALPNAELTKFDATTTAESVVAALTTTTFFATSRIVVYAVEDKTSVTALNQYLKNPLAGSVLLVVYDREKPFANLKGATPVNCNPMPAEILVPLIAKQIAPQTITREAAEYLVTATGGNYSLIDNELRKLVEYYDNLPTLELKHLEPYLAKTLDFQIYELGHAILLRQTKTAQQILNFLLAGNHQEYAIFGGVVSQLRRAYYATATRGDINEIGRVLGCSPYAVKYSRRDYGTQAAAVKELYGKILNLEYQIKAGQMSPTAALSALIYR